jgi:hypothetical protein
MPDEEAKWATVICKVDEQEITAHVDRQDSDGFSLMNISYYKSGYDRKRGFGQDTMVAVMIFQRKGIEKMVFDEAMREWNKKADWNVVLQRNE